MKKITLLLAFIFMSIGLISQTPQAFKYQAVVRNDLGEVINNQTVSFRISIHDSIATGPVQYQETHIVMTNAYGHANLEIGSGTIVIGAIQDIDWADDDKFLEVEFDHLGGIAYASMGTMQLLAVPYAMYSESTRDTTRWRKIEDDLYFDKGTVGIGTTSPLNWAKLDVRGNFAVDGFALINRSDGSDAILDLYNTVSDWELVAASDANRFDIRKWGDVPALSISDNNYVGIGTILPEYNLDIYSNSTAASRLRLSNLDYSKTLFFSSGSDLFDPSIYFQGGDALRFMYYDGAFNEFMRIQSDGNIGIGIDSAFSKLHIEDEDLGLQSSDVGNEIVTIEDYDAGLGLYSDNGGNFGSFLNMGEIIGGSLSDKWSLFRTTSTTGDASQLRFSYGNSPNYYQNPVRMTLDSSGKVGIGTDVPSAGLHLKGDQFPNTFMYLQSDDSQDAGFRLYEGTNDKWHIFNNALLDGLQIYNDIGQTVFFADQTTANVGIGTTVPSADLHVDGIDGVLFTGTYDSGSIPLEGAGTRMMWYPAKAAFRAGRLYASGTQLWNADNIGLYSLAMGYNSNASGQASMAIGSNAIASGNWSGAMGSFINASGDFSTAIGNRIEANGSYSTAIGYRCTSRRTYTTAIGISAKSNHAGSIVISAHSNYEEWDSVSTSGNEQMVFRADGNIYITNTNGAAPFNTSRLINTSTGGYLSTGGTWTDASSKDYKENIAELSTQQAIEAICDLTPVTYNYKVNSEEQRVGFIAEDVPDIVATNDRKGLSSMDIVAILTKVVQNQQSELNMLKQKIEEIENQSR